MKTAVTLATTLIILASMFVITPATAQAPSCDPAGVIAKAAALKSTGDKVKDMTALLSLSQSITDANNACNGNTLKGTGNKVLDSFAINAGTYKVSATLTGFMILQGRSGPNSDCGFFTAETGVLNASPTSITNPKPETHENILEIKKDCRLILNIQNTQGGPWTITITAAK